MEGMKDITYWGFWYDGARLLGQASFEGTGGQDAWIERLWRLRDGSLRLQCWGEAFSRHRSLDGREQEMIYDYTEEDATLWAWRRAGDGLLDYIVLKDKKLVAFIDDGEKLLLLDGEKQAYFLYWEDCSLEKIDDSKLASFIAKFSHTEWVLCQEKYNKLMEKPMKITEWA